MVFFNRPAPTVSMMQNAESFIENLLEKGKLEAAIEAGLLLCKAYDDEENGSIVAQHSARYHALMHDFHAGTINNDDYRPELARINRSMLDWANDIPNQWTVESLKKAGFSASAYELTPAAGAGNGIGKIWILVAGLVLLLVFAIGFAVKKSMFSAKNEGSPHIETTAQTKLPDAKPENQKNTDPVQNQIPPTQKQSDKTVNEKFRSYGNAKFSDGMELGYMGDQFAYRNLKTKEIICCFQKAEEFSGGKARVSTTGKQFFYIDKNGKVLR